MAARLSIGAFLVSLATTAMLAGACAGQSVTGPSASPAPAPAPVPSAPVTSGVLTIRVLSRTSEAPISGAQIAALSTHGATDAAGVFTVSVVPGQEMDVQVSAIGYESMGASAIVGSNERWTFYLPLAGASVQGAVTVTSLDGSR